MSIFDLTVILHKTPAGLQEVAHRTETVSVGARRILIMIDGKRSLADLNAYARAGELEPIVGELVTHGLVDTGERGVAPISVEDFLIATHTEIPRSLAFDNPADPRLLKPLVAAEASSPVYEANAHHVETPSPSAAASNPFAMIDHDRMEHVRATALHHLKLMLGANSGQFMMQIQKAENSSQLKDAIANGQGAIHLTLGKDKARLFMQFVIVALKGASTAATSTAQRR